MPGTFFARFALWVLFAVFFFVPFAFQGSGIALTRMKNDVTDWLPSSFDETGRIRWFWRHFTGENFVVVSWEGCTGAPDDQRYHQFLRKLQPILPPSRRAADATTRKPVAGSDKTPDGAENEPEYETYWGNIWLERQFHFVGDQHGLFAPGDVHHNWGGHDEKWLQGSGGKWFYITPNGDLYEWEGSTAPLIVLARNVWRTVARSEVKGRLVKSLGPVDGPWFYEDPSRLRAQVFRSVTTGPNLLRELTRKDGVLEDNPREAMRRMTGTLFGPDGKQTCLLVAMSDVGLSDFHRALGRGVLGRPRGELITIAEECGIPREELRLGGPPVENVTIDEEGTITLVRMVSLCVVLGMGLAYACFLSVRATIIVFLTGAMSALLALSFVGWTGTTDAVMMSMPALVYVMGISGATHLMNYYRDAVDEHGLVGAPERALAHGWKATVLCSIATSAGLFSLYASDILPIRKYGLYGGLGVLGTLLVLFTFLPAALQIWPLPARRRARSAASQAPSDESAWYERQLAPFWSWFGGLVIRHHYAVAAVCVTVIIVVGSGVARIDTTVNLLKLFNSQATIIQDYTWMEENIGKLAPMDVVIRFAPSSLREGDGEPDETLSDEAAPDDVTAAQDARAADALVGEQHFQYSFLERLEAVDQVQRIIEAEFGAQGRDVVGQTMSAVTFAPVPPPRAGAFVFAQRSATGSQLERHREQFLNSGYVCLDKDDQAELWRISIRVGAFQNVDYGTFVGELRQAVEPAMAAYATREEVLRRIVTQRRGERYAGAHVCLLESAAPPGSDADAPSDPADLQIDPARVFSSSLRELLEKSRVRVSRKQVSEQILSAADLTGFGRYDCVVAIADLPDSAVTRLKNHSRLLIDVRDHLTSAPSSVAVHTVRGTATSNAASQPWVSAVYTGVIPIIYKAQRTLLNSLVESTFWSFITITPLMMFLSRSLRAGLVSMLPNILPVFVVFGAMGWLGIKVDLGCMMTASIALGVAVDDTIHYLTWFREELDRLGDRKQAILAAYRRCATPTLQAAVISGLGLSIFAFSTFTPTQRFGYLMLTILFAGVIAELVYFPALLAGPLGAVFRPRRKADGSDESASGHGKHAKTQIESADSATVNTVPDIESSAVATEKKAEPVSPIPAPHRPPTIGKSSVEEVGAKERPSP